MILKAALTIAFTTAMTAPAMAQQVVSAPSGMVRVLNKTDGSLRDLEIAQGQTVDSGRLKISLKDCRYPRRNPSGNAYAFPGCSNAFSNRL